MIVDNDERVKHHLPSFVAYRCASDTALSVLPSARLSVCLSVRCLCACAVTWTARSTRCAAGCLIWTLNPSVPCACQQPGALCLPGQPPRRQVVSRG
jgi:hypothetical protein